jgi:NADH-quinone oxidoreductase subunit A
MVYFAAVLALVASMLGLSWFLGQRHRDWDTDTPYEAGVAPTGSARLRFATTFYLVALFFVIFDLEAVFLFAWATAARDLGWSGYVGVLIFMGVLVAALFYEWRLGVLEGAGEGAPLIWRPSAHTVAGDGPPVKLGALRRRRRGERARQRQQPGTGQYER